jgi:hypothetical protein
MAKSGGDSTEDCSVEEAQHGSIAGTGTTQARHTDAAG